MTGSDDPREGAPEPSDRDVPAEQRFESRRERRARELSTDAPTGALDPRDLPLAAREAAAAAAAEEAEAAAEQASAASGSRGPGGAAGAGGDLPTGALDASEIPRGPHTPRDGVSALFAEHRFTEVHDEPFLPPLPSLSRDRRRAGAGRGPVPMQQTTATQRPSATPHPASAQRSAPLGATQRALIWATGALVAVLALIGLFALGTRMPQLTAAGAPVPSPTPSRTPMQTPAPTPSATASGPVAAGVHEWDELRGGECLQPFTSAWAQTFTVVDCGQPHAAQLLVRAALPDVQPGAAYPGVDALQSRMGVLCGAPSVIDYGAASGLSDVQVQAAYPADDEQWADGDQDYFCFATRSSGQPLSGSLTPASATPTAAP